MSSFNMKSFLDALSGIEDDAKGKQVDGVDEEKSPIKGIIKITEVSPKGEEDGDGPDEEDGLDSLWDLFSKTKK